MNNYIKKFRDQLPLLKYCEGPGTEEDGIIRHLLSLLDLKSNFLVEFGQCSLGGGMLRRIANKRQASLLNIDPEAAQDEEKAPWNSEQKWVLKQRSVSPLNINQISDECGVPCSPAACVIDVDGMDYWCMLAILQNRRPSLLICEYNCHVPADVSASLSFYRGYQYNKDKNYGASLLALRQLAQAHGYRLTHIHGPLNLYFIPENSRAWGSIEKGLDLNHLQTKDLAALSNTDEFYDNFHQDQRPSWYASDAPDFNQAPWIRLDQIGNVVNTITIDEISLSVYQSDKGGDHYKQRGHKEDSVSPLWRLIRHMLEPEVVIDIGANYGYTAVMLSTRLGARRLIAIEPDPRLFSILSANLTQVSTICTVETIQAAISRQDDCVTSIGINPVSTQDNRVVPEKSWQEAIVPVCSLDKILGSVPRSNRIFIKSDTQGFDINVIRSGFKELSHRNNWMLRCEFAPHWMESQGFSPCIHLEWLCVHFQVFEAPLRTLWNSRKEEVFARPLEVSHVAGFTEYTRSLNHSGKGWLDLYVLPKGYTYKDEC